jgi:hypothetical protein
MRGSDSPTALTVDNGTKPVSAVRIRSGPLKITKGNQKMNESVKISAARIEKAFEADIGADDREYPQLLNDAHKLLQYARHSKAMIDAGDTAIRQLEMGVESHRIEWDAIKADLIRMRQYVMRKGLGIGECVAWCKIKERFGVGIRDADDERWLDEYESR